MRKEAKRWLRQAEADLKAAKDSFKDEDLAPVDYYDKEDADKCL